MSTHEGPAFEGDWRSLLRSRLSARRHLSVLGFAAAHPGLGFVELARLLGDDIAAVQIVRRLFEEAGAKGCVRACAMDALARSLLTNLPNGWAASSDYATATAFAQWSVPLEVHARMPWLKDQLSRTWDTLCELNPPLGWKPQAKDDPLLQEAFDASWPDEPMPHQELN